jgi:hypothetical protein
MHFLFVQSWMLIDPDTHVHLLWSAAHPTHGGTFHSKALPINYLNKWLLQYGLDDSVKDRYVCLDPGGDLGGCTAIIDLFESAGYTVEVTTPDLSHMNGPVERWHQTIGNTMRVMLGGVDLLIQFCRRVFFSFGLSISFDNELSGSMCR